MKKRTAAIKRKTSETDIVGKLNIDGSGKSNIKTGIGLLDHMLQLFAFWGHFDLDITAKGDFNVDIHHTNEDVGIALGQAFKKALGDMKGIERNGSASFPMEDVVANVVLDISGRGSITIKAGICGEPSGEKGYSLKDAEHFFDSFAKHLGMNLNITIDQQKGHDLHTTMEPAFKALGKALYIATQINPRRKGIPSTKGVID